jgi:anti-anti-sigma regulatory factor
MWKIQRTVVGTSSVFRISGRISERELVELRKILSSELEARRTILDLKEVELVDQETVRFLDQCETEGVTIKNCRPYIRVWISRMDHD